MFNNTNYQGKGIQTITSLMSIRMATDKNKETHFGKDVEKREPLGTVGGNINWYSHYGKQYEGSSKNEKKKKNYQVIQLFHFWIFILSKPKQSLEKIHILPCSLQHGKIISNSQSRKAT